ncbi:hypothetical protein QQZ08_004647 [Neonectria magnoliae]|uniref:Uncharacterized protein n=1 Tax=Neonectria magnoliae TaxID=2732573 RepID=A0ABR1I5N9_9HYPO
MASSIANEVSVYDFIVIGAGIASINASYLLRTEISNKSYVVFEHHERIGGTWGFWKYPGIRSDSFLSLFGFAWHQWPHDMDFADPHLIQDYLQDAIRVQEIDKAFGSEDSWYQKLQELNCPPSVLDPGYRLCREEDRPFGSGATAVTLLINLAKAASHVTMLQRSPSYVLTVPSRDKLSLFFLHWLPTWLALLLNWYRHNLLETFHVRLMKTFPNWGKKQLVAAMSKHLPSDIDVNEHFNPSYAPNSQRLCLCPDSDFLEALHKPNCDIRTT